MLKVTIPSTNYRSKPLKAFGLWLKFLLLTISFWLLGNLLTLGSAWERLWPISLQIRLTETAGQYLLRPWDSLDRCTYLTIRSQPIDADPAQLSSSGVNVYYTNRHPIRRPFVERLSGSAESKTLVLSNMVSTTGYGNGDVAKFSSSGMVDAEELLSEFVYPLHIRQMGDIKVQFRMDHNDGRIASDAMLTVYRFYQEPLSAAAAASSLPKSPLPLYQTKHQLNEQSRNRGPRTIQLSELDAGVYALKWSRVALGKTWVNWTIEWTTDRWVLRNDNSGAYGNNNNNNNNNADNADNIESEKRTKFTMASFASRRNDDERLATAKVISLATSENVQNVNNNTDDDDLLVSDDDDGGDDNDDEDSPLDICRSDGTPDSLSCVWTRWQSRYLLLEAWKSADVFISGRYAYPKQLSYDLPQIWIVLVSLIAGYLLTFRYQDAVIL